MRYYNNVDDAKHAVNIGFMKVLSKIEQFSSEFSIATWIRRIIVNSIIDELRKDERYKAKIQLGGELLEYLATDESLAEAKWEHDQLLHMLHQIPEINRTVFNLYVFDGFKHKEIAEQLNTTEGASRWYLSVARKKLKLQLEQHLLSEKKSAEQLKLKA
jgi:RNA polymerase sigma-70 factor (ECF subfamily)